MDILDFALIFVVLFLVWNWSGLKCLFNPIDCATNGATDIFGKITNSVGGIKSFFSDVISKF